jgi:phospholipid-binding lipoprotein MlaA
VGLSSPSRLVCFLLGLLLLAALPARVRADTATSAEDEALFGSAGTQSGFPDPLEGMNRGVFGFNRRVDRWVLTPVTNAYIRVVPGVARRSMRRFFANLNSPSIIANDVLQCEWHDAGVSTARLGINSTIGVAGLGDPATPMGFPEHHSDFGQTMALRGVGSGPYVIMPLLGPTTIRDGFGVLVDFAFRPTTYLFGSAAIAELTGLPGAAGIGDQFIYGTIQGGGTGFIAREEHAKQLQALEESSVDFYATMRSAYYQSRQAAIWGRREDHRTATASPPRSAPPCRPGAPRSFPAGKFPVPRNRRDRSPQCSPSA